MAIHLIELNISWVGISCLFLAVNDIFQYSAVSAPRREKFDEFAVGGVFYCFVENGAEEKMRIVLLEPLEGEG